MVVPWQIHCQPHLWISKPSLLCGFAVWLYWSIITVQMLNLGFPFSKPDLSRPGDRRTFRDAAYQVRFIRLAGGRNCISNHLAVKHPRWERVRRKIKHAVMAVSAAGVTLRFRWGNFALVISAFLSKARRAAPWG